MVVVGGGKGSRKGKTMRLIDADALLDEAMDRYCKECEKRKGIKNGKWRIIYEIGEAPCRACEVDDMKAELEDAPTIDAVPVIRCKECKHNPKESWFSCPMSHLSTDQRPDNAWCWKGERKEDGV